jgi:hypothetical protein
VIKSRKVRDDHAVWHYGGRTGVRGTYIQNFDEETRERETAGKTGRSWDGNIKMNLQDI